MRPEDSELERDLVEALRRTQPPPDFASRVIANLPPEQHRRPPLFGRRMFAVRWVAAALTFVALTASVSMYRYWQYLERGRAAKEQLMVALRITGSTMQLAQERVRSLNADRVHGRTGGTEQVP